MCYLPPRRWPVVGVLIFDKYIGIIKMKVATVAIQVINEKRKSKKCECFKNLKTPFQTLK